MDWTSVSMQIPALKNNMVLISQYELIPWNLGKGNWLTEVVPQQLGPSTF